VLDHGANPGLVQHFTKQALEDIADRWLDDRRNRNKSGRRYELIADARKRKAYNHLARRLGVKVIHISERDTQVASLPKQVDEFVNTWSIEGFYEEGTSPAEMGWGTHEKALPARACVHSHGPLNQICIANMGARTWVRSWVPEEEIVGMVVRHGESFSISEYLTVTEHGVPVYRPTVHYAYHPCDAALVSLHELMMRNYRLQPKLRIMTDEITTGQDKLGCLLMGHDYTAWWIGSLLDIQEARRLVPHQNATTLQVACSCLAATLWMLENPAAGVLLPDYLPHEFILKHARPYLGSWYSKPVDWTPLKNWNGRFSALGEPRPADDEVWQFNTFLLRGRM
jgi:homospermidine synthase